MRVTGSRVYTRPTPTPKMPAGLVELMEGLAKDVLKNNPDDLYAFCAGHMRKLIDIRDGNLPKKQKMSLEDKIKRAQEQVRQKIQERLMQYDDKSRPSSEKAKETNPSNETKEKNPIVAPTIHLGPSTPTQDADIPEKPVNVEELAKVSEVETNEPNVTVATVDIFQEPLIEPQESEHIVKENDGSNAENEVVREAMVRFNADEDSPINSDTLYVEVLTKEIETESVKGGNSETKDVPITSETLAREDLIRIDESEKVSQIDAKPISSQLPIENSANEPKETTAVQTKIVHEIEYVEIDNPSEDKVTRSTENMVKGGVEKHSGPLVNTDVSKANTFEKILSTEIQSVEIVKKPTEEKDGQTVNEALYTESGCPKLTQIEDDLNKKNHDTDNEKNVEHGQLVEQITNNLESEIIRNEASNDDKEEYKETKEEEDKNGDQLQDGTLQESKIVETDSSSNIEHSEIPTNNCIPQDATENMDKNTKENENVTFAENPEMNSKENKNLTVREAETTQIFEHLKSAPLNESGEIKNELSVVEGNVMDSAREFLDQERQFSAELVTEASDVIFDKSTLETNNTNTTALNNTPRESDASFETNPAGTGMDLETAAVTIQKVFRTFLFSKSRTSTLDDGMNENSLEEDVDKKGETEFISSANINKERRALGISRMDTVLQTVNEEKSLSLSTDESSTLSSAATTIQAHVRGFLVRNRLASYKTPSNSSLVNSDGPSTVSLDGEGNEPKKTILNIHIVPERGQFMSRDESILTSIDLPLDNSPPSSVNLHPLGYDKSEPRKQLKREDAIQSVSPPSNNSGKLSEEVDSMKENENNDSKMESEYTAIPSNNTDQRQEDAESCDTTLTISSTADTVVDAEIYNPRELLSSPEHDPNVDVKNKDVANLSSDELDVVTPFPSAEKTLGTETNEKPKLIHSGEFHDMVVQTQVKRSETSVVREFKNVLVYFLIWDKT